MQANQKGTIWTMIICTVVLLVMVGMIAMNINSKVEAVKDEIPTAAEIVSQIDIPTAAGIGDLNIPTAAEIVAAMGTLDNDKLDKVCDLTEGCDGQWDINNFMRGLAVNVVMEELEDRTNKELYDGIKGIVDIREREDIDSVHVHDTNGEMTVNQEDYDSLYDANDDTIVTVEFVIEVTYFDDEDNEDRTRWFKVTATVSDVEDGIAEGDVEIVSVERVSEHFEFD